MADKYNAKDKFTAKEGDFEIVYRPPKKQPAKKDTGSKKKSTKK